MKKILLVLIVCSFAEYAFAQDYINTNSTYQQGKVSRHGKNSLILRKQGIEGYTTISLDTVNDFKAGGTVYKAFKVNGSRNSFMLLESGRIKMYRAGGTYLLEDSSKVTTFDKKNFRSVLLSTLQCSGRDQSLSRLDWNKKAIKQIVRSYNEGGCNTDAIPHPKFGVVAGYNLMKTTISPVSDWKPSKTNGVPTIGAFMDLPLRGKRSILFFTLEGNYFSSKPAYYTNFGTKQDFMALDLSGVNTIGSFKLLLNKDDRVKAYLKAGAIMSFLKVSSPTGLIIAKKNGSVVDLDGTLGIVPSSSTQIGFNAALGVEVVLQKRTNLHFELRSTSSAGNDGHVNIHISNVGITAGISF
jgi:hypothetical protein